MGVLSRALDTVFLLYFASHIPITVFVDSQSVFPAEWYPQWAKDALQWHIKTNNDHLVRDNPPWFLSLVACECFVQFPFFFVATYAFIAKANWIRIPALIYGVHVSTTMVPILAEILYGSHSGPHSLALAGIYAPYLIVPLLLAIKMSFVREPFSVSGNSRPKSKFNKIA